MTRQLQRVRLRASGDGAAGRSVPSPPPGFDSLAPLPLCATPIGLETQHESIVFMDAEADPDIVGLVSA